MAGKLKLNTILWILCALGIGTLPYFYNGVFFERGHNIVDLILLILLIGGIGFVSIQSLIKKRDKSDNTNRFIHKPNRYDIAFGIFVLCYIQAVFHAASISLAIVGATDTLALIVPYMIFRSRLQSGLASTWVLFGLALASVGVNVIGMANGWGQLLFPSAIDTTQGIRIASVFQYHNAYAAFTAAISLGLLTYVSLMKNARLIVRAVGIGIASLNIAGLILSGSRGALALWLGVSILTIVSLRDTSETNATRTRFLRDFYVALISAGLAYILIHRGISHTSALYGWTGILVAIVAPVLIVYVAAYVARKYFQSLSTWKYSFLTLIGIGVVVAGVIGSANAQSLIHKISSYQVHQLSVAQRFIFWKDGLKIVGLNPLFGSGSGAWHAMFMRVESYPYYSTQVHSFFVDVLMEAGIVGLIALFVAIWPMIRFAVWPKLVEASDDRTKDFAGRRAIGAVGFMVFIHSLMDWDMAFQFMEMLFIMGIGSTIAAHQLSEHATVKQTGSKKISVWSRFCIPVVGVAGIAGGLITIQSLRAQSVDNAAHSTVAGSQQQIDLYQNAHRIYPYNPAFLIENANTLMNGSNNESGTQSPNVKAALSLYEQAAKLDPFSPQTLGNGARIAYQLGQYPLAANLASKAFYNAPFLQDYITLALNGNALDGLSNSKQNPMVSEQAFKEVQSLYGDYTHNLEIVKNLPSYLPPLDPYLLGDFAYDSVAASYLGTHQPEVAEVIATKVENSTDAHTAATAKLIILISKHDLGQAVTDSDIEKFIRDNANVQRSAAYLMALK